MFTSCLLELHISRVTIPVLRIYWLYDHNFLFIIIPRYLIIILFNIHTCSHKSHYTTLIWTKLFVLSGHFVIKTSNSNQSFASFSPTNFVLVSPLLASNYNHTVNWLDVIITIALSSRLCFWIWLVNLDEF